MTETLPDQATAKRWLTRNSGPLQQLGLRPPAFLFRRWSVPIKVGIQGLPDEFDSALRAGFAALADRTGHPLTFVDMATANLRYVAAKGWYEFANKPEMYRLIPGIRYQVPNLRRNEYSQFRKISGARWGGITRFGSGVNTAMPRLFQAGPLSFGLSQAFLMFLNWAPSIWSERPLMAERPADAGDLSAFRPGLIDFLTAAYDPSLPNRSRKPEIVDRILARAVTRA